MIGWILNGCYVIAFAAWFPWLCWQQIRHRKVRSGWWQKLSGSLQVPPHSGRRRIWLHAVSVGEVLQLRQVIQQLRQADPTIDLVVTTTTSTGFAVANEKLTDCSIAYFPLDFTWSVRRALDVVQPDLISLVELELWPNLLRETNRRGIPVALINGRLSARSFRGYRWLKWGLGPLLRTLHVIAVQTEEYRDRFLALGAHPERVIVSGSIKFDGVETCRGTEGTRQLSNWLAISPAAKVLVVGSTQAPEERIALEAYQQLKARFPQLRLALVPRHPERGDEVAELITAAGFRVLRRTATRQSPVDASFAGSAVGLLDTVGELGSCWGLADVAFVGGSFTDRGGQNMLEPSAFGAAVCFGPNTWNFRQTVELLLARNAARQLQHPEQLAEYVAEMLEHPEAAAEQGARAQQLILQQQGATRRTVHLLLQGLTRRSGSGRQHVLRAA